MSFSEIHVENFCGGRCHLLPGLGGGWGCFFASFAGRLSFHRRRRERARRGFYHAIRPPW